MPSRNAMSATRLPGARPVLRLRPTAHAIRNALLAIPFMGAPYLSAQAQSTTTLPTVEVTASGGATSGGAASHGYAATRTTTATKTDTPLRDVPQSVTVVTQELIEDQAMQSIADVLRYVPGVGISQGEGNRDAAVFRGIGSTGDFFVDGIRDDVQYYRDLYDIERVEVLKGPNAMIFGRGGAGGVLNRVTRQARWEDIGEVTLQAGSWRNRRASADFGRPLGERAAFRVAGVYEDSEGFRDFFELERYGIRPTFALRAGDRTLVRIGYEHFKDERVADRGIPSFAGRPVQVDPSTFFGNPDESTTFARIDALDASVDHDFGNGLALRNQTRWAVYDKFYQNVFPGAVNAAGTMVSIAAYNNQTDRTNVFNQTDLSYSLTLGGLRHDLLGGIELGRQTTDNFRNTGFFVVGGARTTSVPVPLSAPRTGVPVEFAQSATDANNHGTVDVAALYLQDRIEFSPQWQAIVGVRFDRFDVDFINRRNGQRLQTTDNLVSPRLGLVYKPSRPLSIYGSYSVSYVPRAGDQLSSLNPTNEALDPEEFRNVEVGVKWDLAGDLAATAALYRLERGNVAIADPADITRSILVDAQRARGVELGLAGGITPAWRVMGGYAYQDGEITRTQSASAQAGARLAQLPRHSFSLWNRYDFDPTWGIGVGVVARSSMHPSVDNAVTLPGFARVDAALFYEIARNVKLQLNVENLFDREYHASAHSNNNIMPGSPRALRVSLSAKY